MAFAGTQQKCSMCSKTVYLVEKLTADHNRIFHKSCFRCHRCKGTLKVADFGLVKLVERSSEEDCIATRLVGTPGYLPPESVRELQMTSKGDVFAFGVVLAELITGCHALM